MFMSKVKPTGVILISTVLLLLIDDYGVFALFVPQILYETDRILVINKPSGIPHHNDASTGELGVVSLLRNYYNQTATTDTNSTSCRLYGVHRLDRVTSGILLLAKDVEMARILSKAFRDQTIVKYYVGISHRKPKKKKQGWVKGTMVRGRRKSWYLMETATTTKNKNNKKDTKNNNFAVTRFFTAGLGGLYHHHKDNSERHNDKNSNRNTTVNVSGKAKTCILFRPHTGRTHQLRVAAKSLGLGLLGDPIYGRGSDESNDNGDSMATVATTTSSGNSVRTCLHATALHIPLSLAAANHQDNCNNNHHHDHEDVTIYCPPPFGTLLWPDDRVCECQFQQIVSTLFQKYCECPEILEQAIQLQNQGTPEPT